MEKKKGFQMPHTYIIIFGVILFAALLTVFIPLGKYDTKEITYMQNGVEKTRTVLDPESFQYILDENGNELSEDEVIATALDEITSMKILSRIEGDDTKVKHSLLEKLITTIETQLLALTGEDKKIESVSISKLKEMQGRLSSGYTSFWS